MPDQRDGHDDDALGLDWLAAQLSDDDSEDEADAPEVTDTDGAAENGAADPDTAADAEPASTLGLPITAVAPSVPPVAAGEADSGVAAAATTRASSDEFQTRAERVAAENAIAARESADRIAAERAAAAERVAAQRAELDRAAAAERVAAQRAELDRAEAERVEMERLAAERAAADRADSVRVAAEQAAAASAAAERAEAERVAADTAAAERAHAERAEAQRAEAQRAEAERAAAERAEAERAAAEQAASARAAAERAAAERATAERAEAERVEAQSSEAEQPASPAAPEEFDEQTPEEPASAGFKWGLTPAGRPDRAESRERRTPLAKATPAAIVPPVTPATPVPATPVPNSPAPASVALPPGPTDDTPEEPLTKTPAPLRRSSGDLEPAPWWTTPAQSRLEPTEEEQEAARSRRAAPRPLETGAAQPLRPAAVQPEKPSAKPAPVTPPVTQPVAAAAATTVAPAPSVLPVAHDEPESASLALVAAVTAASDPRADGPTGAWSDSGRASGPPPRRPTRRTLAWIGGAILIVLIIIGLFFVGIGLGGGSTPVATDSGSATPSAAPAPTEAAPPAATGPLAAGVHSWSAMFGTECLEPYTSPWDEEFTVVDCATPHTAQLVYRGILDGASGSEFPGEEAMAAQINLLCSAPGVIDFQAASAYTDLQLQGSYPVTTEQWANGDRYYYCFASRSSGEPLTGSLAPVA